MDDTIAQMVKQRREALHGADPGGRPWGLALSGGGIRRASFRFVSEPAAQTTALRTRREAIQLTTQRLQASVALIRAIGGGWQAPETANAAPAASRAS